MCNKRILSKVGAVAHVSGAEQALYRLAKCYRAARRDEYTSES